MVFLETRERKRDRVGDTGRRQRQGERGGGCRDRGMEAEKVPPLSAVSNREMIERVP